MDDAARAALEQKVRSLLEAGDRDGAVTAALRGYGPEIFGFLVALHRSEQDAADVFSTFGEAFWKGLPGFAWECSLRAWAYTIARNASYRFRKTARRAHQGQVPLSEASAAVAAVAAKVRTETLTYLRTEQKDGFSALRESLPAEDQTLLILRVDRRLAWEELARVMMEGDEPPTPEALKRESARLRKRFQLVKEKLVAMGERAGLIPKKEPE